jgi:predicted DNA-binding transcriptional regulator AlpA
MPHLVKTKSKKLVVYDEALEKLREKNPHDFLSQKQVQEKIPFSRMQLFRMYNAKPPKFPVPFRIVSRSLFWTVGEITKWMDAQRCESNRATVKKLTYAVGIHRKEVAK